MNEERFRRLLHEALDQGRPDPDLRERVVAALPAMEGERRPRRQWALGITSGLLAMAMVAGLVHLRAGSGSSSVAATGPSVDARLITPISYRCSLPLVSGSSGGFLTFPDGRFVTDGTYNSRSGQTWDAVLGRWLPVSAQWISADGRSYAYAQNTTGAPGQSGTSAIRVVDIASGRDREVWHGEGSSNLVGWAGGVYFTRNQAGPGTLGSGTGPQLWSVDPAGGSARAITPQPPPAGAGPPVPYFGQVRGGFGWATAVSQVPPSPSPGAGSRYLGPDRLLRLDLRDGSVTQQFNQSGTQVSIAGFDQAGRPILNLTVIGASPPPRPRLVLLTGTDQVTDIGSAEMVGPPQSVQADAHGLWISSGGFLWLHTDREGTRKVADFRSFLPSPSPRPILSGMPAATSTIFPLGRFAGPCV